MSLPKYLVVSKLSEFNANVSPGIILPSVISKLFGYKSKSNFVIKGQNLFQ